MIFAAIIFFISLVGISALFIAKYWEEQHEHVLVQKMRQKADERALQVKLLLSKGRFELLKLKPTAIRLARAAIHIAALQTAHLARVIEAQAHRLADFVSHKHHFERREPKSEFLKKVGEYKNGNENSSRKLDTSSNNGHNS